MGSPWIDRLARSLARIERRPAEAARVAGHGQTMSRDAALKTAAALALGFLLPTIRVADADGADSCVQACHQHARDEAGEELTECLASHSTFIPALVPSLGIATYVGCLAGAGAGRLVRASRCNDGAWSRNATGTCGPDTSQPRPTPRTYDHYPPKPPAQRKKKPPKKPPAQPGLKPLGCQDCPPNSFCDPCSSNALGFVCCYLPKKNGKSPCCA